MSWHGFFLNFTMFMSMATGLAAFICIMQAFENKESRVGLKWIMVGIVCMLLSALSAGFFGGLSV